MVRSAPGRRHVAVEPIPALASALWSRFPDIDVYAGALSDRAGEREFAHVTTREGWSGFERRPTPDAADRIQTIRVQTTTLDDLVGDRDVAFVKIDVEGAELEVLRGGRTTLRRCRPVVAFEHGLGSADHYGTQPDQVYDLLADDLGMEIHDLEGGGPYGRTGFSAAFWNQDRVNFVARPR
jgi:FkbM family methyltransferase